jgi:hypothetical protein
MASATASAEQTTTVQLNDANGEVVASVDIEIVDTRSGMAIRTATSGEHGRAVFQDLSTGIMYQAQTTDGRFVSMSFEAGATIALKVGSKEKKQVTTLSGWELSMGISAAAGGNIGRPLNYEIDSFFFENANFERSITSGFTSSITIDARFASPSVWGETGSQRFFLVAAARINPDPVEKFVDSFANATEELRTVVNQGIAGWTVGLGYSHLVMFGSRTLYIEPALEISGSMYELKILVVDLTVGESRQGINVSKWLVFAVPKLMIRTNLLDLGPVDMSLEVGVFASIPIANTSRLFDFNSGVGGSDLRLFAKFVPKPVIGGVMGLRFTFNNLLQFE